MNGAVAFHGRIVNRGRLFSEAAGREGRLLRRSRSSDHVARELKTRRFSFLFLRDNSRDLSRDFFLEILDKRRGKERDVYPWMGVSYQAVRMIDDENLLRAFIAILIRGIETSVTRSDLARGNPFGIPCSLCDFDQLLREVNVSMRFRDWLLCYFFLLRKIMRNSQRWLSDSLSVGKILLVLFIFFIVKLESYLFRFFHDSETVVNRKIQCARKIIDFEHCWIRLHLGN